MAQGRAGVVLLVVTVLAAVSGRLPGIHAQLSPNYYANTCPRVESIVAAAFRTQINLIQIITAPASLLRVAFHDCAVNGCDASIMLDSQGTVTDEKDSERNLGISNLDVIDSVKQTVERSCPGVVSCADIIAMVGREAVRFAGGPSIQISLGRRDSRTASKSAADRSLLPADASVSQVLSSFAQMGIDTQGAVALLGAHTIGVAHCANIVNRLYPLDATLSKFQNFGFRAQLQAQCPPNYSPNTVITNDATNTIFDTTYFNAAVNQERGLLSIDDALAKDPRTQPFMSNWVLNAGGFRSAFAAAYDQMTKFNVLTGSEGEVRLNCRRIN